MRSRLCASTRASEKISACVRAAGPRNRRRENAAVGGGSARVCRRLARRALLELGPPTTRYTASRAWRAHLPASSTLPPSGAGPGRRRHRLPADPAKRATSGLRRGRRAGGEDARRSSTPPRDVRPIRTRRRCTTTASGGRPRRKAEEASAALDDGGLPPAAAERGAARRAKHPTSAPKQQAERRRRGEGRRRRERAAEEAAARRRWVRKRSDGSPRGRPGRRRPVPAPVAVTPQRRGRPLPAKRRKDAPLRLRRLTPGTRMSAPWSVPATVARRRAERPRTPARRHWAPASPAEWPRTRRCRSRGEPSRGGGGGADARECGAASSGGQVLDVGAVRAGGWRRRSGRRRSGGGAVRCKAVGGTV